MDERLRELERAWRGEGDLEARAAYLAERARREPSPIPAPELEQLLKRLGDRKVLTRLELLRRLIEADPTPLAATLPLVERLEDPATWREEFTDWDGTVVADELHVVAERAATALGGVGAPALWCLLDAVGEGAAGAMRYAARVVERMSAPALREVSAADRAQARALIEEVAAPPAGHALKLLAWADAEAEAGRDPWADVVERLGHPHLREQQRAATALREHPRPAEAAAILCDAIEAGEPLGLAVKEAVASLAALGPVLDDARLKRLIARARAHEPFGALPTLLPALAAYGAPAARLGPTLLAWLRDDPPRQIGKDHLHAVRRGATEALGLLGDLVSRRVERDLLRGWWAADYGARRTFVEALGAEPRAREARLADATLPRLRRELRRRSLDALERLGDLGAEAAPAVPEVLPFLASTSRHDGAACRLACAVLGAVGEAARPALPTLIAMIDSPQADWALIAIRKLGAVAAEAEPAVAARLERVERGELEDRGRFTRSALEALRAARDGG